jgi:hypothetical protein
METGPVINYALLDIDPTSTEKTVLMMSHDFLTIVIIFATISYRKRRLALADFSFLLPITELDVIFPFLASPQRAQHNMF